jgi:hypothetical protein
MNRPHFHLRELRTDVGPSALRHRLHASASASGASHRLLSRLCSVLHPGAELSPPHALLSVKQDRATTLRRSPVPSTLLTPVPQCPPRAAGFTVTKPPCR